MLYLLTAFWEWFAVALFIGLVVGWLTTTREKDREFSGRGAVATAIFLVAGGFLLANLQTVPGRAGLLLETALLIVSAYGLGLPLGGGAKLLTAAALPSAPAKKKPPLVVVRGAPLEDDERRPEPVRQAPPTPAPSRQIPPPPPPVFAEPTPLEAPAPQAPAAPAEKSKKLPGLQPAGLPQPRDGTPDDLAKIKGVGPKSVEKLHALGVYHFDQIAAWTPENVKWISGSLAVPGRIERGRWVAQAKELASAGHAATAHDDVSAQAQ